MPGADDVLDLADRLWRGEVTTTEVHPLRPHPGLAEVADGVAFVPSFANVSAIGTDDGLVLVDTGSAFVATEVHDTLRRWSPSRLNTAIYSHGHIDHVFGVPVWAAESAGAGVARTGGGGPRGAARPLRPLHPDRRLQRHHQPAPVRHRVARMADRVPVPRPHLPGPARPGGRRGRRRAPPCPGGDRRPHLDVVPRPARAVLRRPVHLGVAQRRQPAEGPALPARVGRRPSPHARPLRRRRVEAPRSCCPATATRWSGRTGSARPSATPPSCSSPWSARRWPS